MSASQALGFLPRPPAGLGGGPGEQLLAACLPFLLAYCWTAVQGDQSGCRCCFPEGESEGLGSNPAFPVAGGDKRCPHSSLHASVSSSVTEKYHNVQNDYDEAVAWGESTETARCHRDTVFVYYSWRPMDTHTHSKCHIALTTKPALTLSTPPRRRSHRPHSTGKETDAARVAQGHRAKNWYVSPGAWLALTLKLTS